MALTNAQLVTNVDSNIITNNNNEITGAILNGVFQEFVKRLTVRVAVSLSAGVNEIANPYGSIVSNVQVWQKQSGKTILLGQMDIYTVDATETTKFFINSPDALTNCIVTFNV